jgi:soluble lytic murein transglycosylase
MNGKGHPLKLRLLVGAFSLLIACGIQPSATLAQESSPALDAANAALFLGDYDTAITEYNNALVDPLTACPALYGLGITHMRATQFNDADSVFTRYLNECETSFRVLVMRGEVRQELGKAPEALADYQQAITVNPGLLDTYLYERMTALNPDLAGFHLRLAVDADRHPEGKFTVRERLAELYLLIGSPEFALAEYNTILSEIDAYLATLSEVEGSEFDESGNLRARIELAASELEIQINQPEAAYARLQRIITTYTETSSALPALIALVTANQSVDLQTRMQINVLNENYAPVVGVLTDMLADPATAETAPAELFLLLGRAQRGLGDYEAALATFDNVRQRHPASASMATLELGQTYLESGSYPQAVQALNEVATNYPDSPEAPEALLRAAETERDFGDANNALNLYIQLGTRYPQSEQAQQGLFEAGMVARSSDPTRAAELFGLVGTSQGFVWQGKMLEQAGNPDAARQAWTQATAAEPGTFFAMRGCVLLNNLAPFSPSSTLQVPPITDVERAEAEQWVAQTFGLEGVSSQLSPELANNPMLRRGAELWEVGMWVEARGEFDALHKLSRDNPVALLQLAFHYQTIPVYRSSVFAATRLVFLSEVPFSRIPRAVLQLAYPFYYVELISSASAEYNLDPLLVASLIRQETSFDAFAISIADARGMMQFVPSTAQDVADRLGRSDYTLNDLFRPIVNVPFGAYYLASMRDFQNGSVAGALLSYNAGPGASQSWISEAGNDIELLYETIAFEETRLYLELIYQNYTVYQHLYGGGVPACMFESAAGG